MKRTVIGFSLLEILLSMTIISFAFLPIYNLFRFSHQGTRSNEREIFATNYASDLVNFLRDQKASVLDRPGLASRRIELNGDDAIRGFFQGFDPPRNPPPAVSEGFVRSLVLEKFDGRDDSLVFIGPLRDFWLKKQSVPNYLAEVKVEYSKRQAGSKEGDEVVIYSLIMD